MPELPEVETLARGLQQTVAGRRIVSVTLGKTDFIDDPAALEQHLPGQLIERVERFGKFMLMRLSNAKNGHAPGDAVPGGSLLVHLGMTGHLSPHATVEPFPKHTHARFLLDDGRELRYTDARRFGRMAYFAAENLPSELGRFGDDPLEITEQDFAALLKLHKSRIKALLLKQSALRGVGNIYADESLWRSRIHPTRIAARLSPEESRKLRRALQEILREAIELRGSSISDFLDAEGRPGEYQRRHRAYGRETKPCYRCKTPIRRVIVAGRSSYFCPRCQPAPKPAKRTAKRGKRVTAKGRAASYRH
ncbi:MAG TPA: bifunctional DNA-formamidopyrimidine glycosylase/DNA-(apurinic or apyrimidinic site) lyase [Candidatus Dormibacteraeota bacterium]|nr:bifunctional DNA-formamidopyrimidine glycosylase/DNA-(apurinic or apyrimidinic site) lyase [Candidatus Dormibacteraeota bacterium]